MFFAESVLPIEQQLLYMAMENFAKLPYDIIFDLIKDFKREQRCYMQFSSLSIHWNIRNLRNKQTMSSSKLFVFSFWMLK